MFDETLSGSSLRPGQVVDAKYRIERVIGQGAMGVVFEATHLHLGERVAIKVLLGAASGEALARQRLLREARAGMGIQSEHVARIMDVGFLESSDPFVVMELLDGADLRAVLEARGPLPVEEAVDYVLQASEALVEAHARGIVHRDLKLGNLFVTRRIDGTPLVKVLDFGISKVPVLAGAPDLSLTETRAMLGSPLYMSPEQVRSSKHVDRRTDLWALGVILYKLLGGGDPFAGETFSALCAAIAADAPAPLRQRAPGVPEALERAILQCLEKDPEDRFDGVAELAAALAPFASERGRLSAQRVVAMGRPAAPGAGVAITRAVVTAEAGRSASAPARSAPSGAERPLEGSGTLPTSWGAGERQRARRSVVLAAAVATLATGAMALVVVAVRDRDRAHAGAGPSPSLPVATVSAAPSASTPPPPRADAPDTVTPSPANTPEAGAAVSRPPSTGTPPRPPLRIPTTNADPGLDKRN